MSLTDLWRRHPLAIRLVLFFLLPLLLIGGWLWVHLLRSLPETGTTRLTQGVSAPVTLIRDAHGTVLIKAANDRDAYYAIGYAQAQDRLWQLQLQRWMVRGRLSEVFGKNSIDSDVWFRTLGLHESARNAWPALSPPAQASLTAYTAGVNAAIAQTRTLPLEFQLFGVQPEAWTPVDSLAWTKMFALNLGGNFRREIDHYLARSALTPTQAAFFFPGYPLNAADAPPVGAAMPALAGLADWQDRLQRDSQFAHFDTGSNAWAVQGRLTSSGGALLSNDPHLGLQIPSSWYAIAVDSPTLKTSGMSLVGLPVVVFGRNERIAWGGTNMMADTQDLYLERADAEGKQYESDGTWKPFETRSESIRVRADFPERLHRPYVPIALKVRRSEHGPIVSDYFGLFDAPVALRWTGLDTADTSYEAFFRLGYAQDWNQFKQALGHHVAPAMNMLYADRAGNIGQLGAGRIPIRKKGSGTLPVPGWDTGYGWSGYIPPAQWPETYNPPSGYLVNANNRIVGEEYPYFISHDWASPARARRIEQLLREHIDSGHKLSADDMKRIQADTLDLDAARLMGVLRKRLPDGRHAAQAAQYLSRWDGDMRADSQAAAIFHSWMRHLRQRLFQERLRGTWEAPQAGRFLDQLGAGVGTAQLTNLLEGDGGGWCDQTRDTAKDSCSQLLAASQADALEELYKLRGDWSMRSWQWGKIQRTLYAHAPLSSMKPLNKVFERRIGNGGSADTVNVAVSRFVEGEGYLQDFGPGFRQVIELGPAGIAHSYMSSTGQSGNVLSPYYDDMIKPFRNVGYVRFGDSAGAADRQRTPSPREAPP